MLEKQFSSFHYFEEKFQYRIERSPVITGDLKNELLENNYKIISYINNFYSGTSYKSHSPTLYIILILYTINSTMNVVCATH